MTNTPTTETFVDFIGGFTSEEEEAAYTVVYEEQEGSGRWNSYHRIVLQDVSSKKFYAADYELGLTEYQETADDYSTQVVGEVKRIEKTVYEYVPVKKA